MKRFFLSTCIVFVGTGLSAAEMTSIYDGAFPRFPADNWADAAAHLTIRQSAVASEVTVVLENARPDTLFTLWVRPMGKTPDGAMFGGNPLMKIPGVAMIPATELPRAVAMIKSPSGNASNGFMSDANGNGSVTLKVDFPIVGGAYPFDRFQDFDAQNAVYNQTPPRAIPVAVVGKAAGAPFTIRLTSHCADNLSHRLVAGPHEAWFDWLAD